MRKWEKRREIEGKKKTGIGREQEGQMGIYKTWKSWEKKKDAEEDRVNTENERDKWGIRKDNKIDAQWEEI